jgi:solute:Na+ symporter, SSS family
MPTGSLMHWVQFPQNVLGFVPSMKLNLTYWDWIVLIVVLGGSMVAGVALAVRRRMGGSSEGFFLAGRRLLWPIVGLSLFASNIGAEHIVGLSGDSYRYGLKAGTVELSTVICLGMACWLLFPAYIKTGIFTIPEFLEKRYDVRARLFFSGFMIVICIMTKMAFTLFAGAAVLHSLPSFAHLNIMWTVAVLAFLAAGVTMIGGFAAVAYTDAIQASIIIGGCAIMTIIGLTKVGGWSGLEASVGARLHVAAPLTDPDFPFWGILIGVVYGGLFYWGMDQVNVQRVLGARDLKQGRWGAMFAVVLKFAPLFIFALPGVIAYALDPSLTHDQSKQTFVWLLNNLLPTGLRGLVLASLLAAIIASKLAVMNSVSTMVVRDFVGYFSPGMKEKRQLVIGRLVMLLTAALGVMATWLIVRTQEGLYRYLQAISFYLCVPLVPPIFWAIVNRRVNMKGAVAGVAAGLALSVLYLVDNIIPNFGKEHLAFLHTTYTLNYTFRGLWQVLLVTAVLFLVSWLTSPPSPEKVENTVVNVWRKPEPWQGIKDWRLHCGTLALITALLYWRLR